MIYKGIEELVGNTPLVRFDRYKQQVGLKGNIFAKLEYFNPAGSMKDRVALNIIEQAEKSGKLKKDGTIIEATSGNTGIGLSSIGKAKGYYVKIVMPDNMSEERIKLMASYGAEVILTDSKDGMTGSIEEAKRLNKEIKESFLASQFENEDNIKAHFEHTGKELWDDLKGNIDIIVISVGTGGSFTGIAKFLKGKNSNIKVFAVEPECSAVLSGEVKGEHKIQGIGAGFVPKLFDRSLADGIIKISDEEAYEKAKICAETEGIFVGISSGAVLSAVGQILKNEKYRGKNIVAILPDGGNRYLSTEGFIDIEKIM